MSRHFRRIAYYITPHGFGHAVRSLEIIRGLLQQDSGVEITLVSEIPELLVMQNIGRPLPYRRRRLDFGLIQLDSVRFDLASTLSALADLKAGADLIVDEESEFLKSRHIDLVVADIPFLPFQAARRCGIPSLGVGNFTWDWIYSTYTEQDPRWPKLIQWIAAGYGQCDLLLRLPMHGDCSACPRHVDVPLVARHSNRPPEETRGLLGLDPLQPAYLLAFATLDLDDSALRAVETIPEAVFLFKHPLDYRLSNGLCLDPFDLSYPDVIAASDAVITKPGYGIVSDCLSHGTPMIYTDRGDFPEYPILVDAMRKHLPVAYMSSQDLYSGRWDHALAEIRRCPRRPVNLGTDGAEVCAQIILEALGGP
ncbi:MAG: hypothetical protein MUC41_07405 [Syntrophobacteraceae bacterium]|jgi:L-arabinokinase|nr:hypothetical protein [Syntrophobacteraceae bacterium]